MWKNWLIFILGLALIFIPFLGLPLSFAKSTYVVIGLLILLTSFYAARDLHFLMVLLDELPDEKPTKDHSFLNSSMSEIVDDQGAEETSSIEKEKLV